MNADANAAEAVQSAAQAIQAAAVEGLSPSGHAIRTSQMTADANAPVAIQSVA